MRNKTGKSKSKVAQHAQPEESNTMPWLEEAVRKLNRELNIPETPEEAGGERGQGGPLYKVTFVPKKRLP